MFSCICELLVDQNGKESHLIASSRLLFSCTCELPVDQNGKESSGNSNGNTAYCRDTRPHKKRLDRLTMCKYTWD